MMAAANDPDGAARMLSLAASAVDPTAPRVWMDITTSLRADGRSNGTTRVERSLARGLAAQLGPRLSFCRTHASRFMPAAALADSPSVPETDATTMRSRRGPGASHAHAQRLDRRIERAVRHFARAMAGRLRARMAQDLFPAARAGDCVLLAGETWSPRYDYDALRTLRERQGLRIAALCQDVIPVTDPQFFDSADFVARYRAYVEFLLRDTDVVMAISHSTASELDRLKRAAGLATRIEVVHLGSDFVPAPGTRPPRAAPELATLPFVLSVSTIQSRKNFDLLYRVWKRFAAENRERMPMLVIVGQRGFGSDDLLWQIANDPAVKTGIRLLHDVSDDELAWLYRHCGFTLYPSFAEGWGLPISESLASGKLCVASNTTSMPEAGQGVCIHLDPIDVAAWHNTIASLLETPSTIRDHEARIAAAYRPRTWSQTAIEIAGVMSTLAADHGRADIDRGAAI